MVSEHHEKQRRQEAWGIPEEIVVDALQRSRKKVDDAGSALSIPCPGHIVLV